MSKYYLIAIFLYSFFSLDAQWTLEGNSDTTPTSRLGTMNTSNLNVFSGGQQRMIIKANNGFVGVGLLNPQNCLHIHGIGKQNSGTRAEIGDVTRECR
jgi:hypothetical protein